MNKVQIKMSHASKVVGKILVFAVGAQSYF